MNSLVNLVQSRISAIQQYIGTIKATSSPEGLQPWLSIGQEHELIVCALFKISTCFLELAQLCLSNLQLSSTQKKSMEASIANNSALLANLYIQVCTEVVPKKAQATKQAKVKILRDKFAQLNIRIPKAPVSAFYLFFLHSKRKSKNQPKRNFSTEWSNMQSFEKQPYQLLANDIHQKYHKQVNLKHHDTHKPTIAQGIRKSSLKKIHNKPEKLEYVTSNGSSCKRKNSRQSISEQSNEDILSDSQAQMLEQHFAQPFQKELKVGNNEIVGNDIEDKQRKPQFNCPQVKI